MTLTIYGSHRSRTMRVLWMAEELGLDYVHVPYAHDDPALKTPEFLAINPAGAIPAIEDDGRCLAESLAICVHLARTRGRLYPSDESDLWRWLLFAQGHIEPWVQRDEIMLELRAALPAGMITRIVAPALARLEGPLAPRDYLIGQDFTVADLAVASILSPSRTVDLDLAPYPALRAWIARCFDRPAARAVREKFA